jgi:predicted permease
VSTHQERPVLVGVVALFFPLALGLLAGRLGVFPEPDRAIDALNRLALHVAFPALVIVGLADPEAELARHPAFLAIVPASLLASIAIVRAATLAAPAAATPLREQAGTIALVIAFGNTAYLGLPYLAAVLGDTVVATASIAVSLHVACAMTLGPYFLARWSGGSARASLARIARQPLIWSPIVALLLRAAPEPVVSAVRAILDPLARTAAPVSMLLLGLYLYENRARMQIDRSIALHVAARLVLVPAVTLAMTLAAHAIAAITPQEAAVLVILAAMPAAITTFSIALEQGARADRVAATIVASTAASVVTLPLATWIASSLWPQLR